jgi:hypothetical protein
MSICRWCDQEMKDGTADCTGNVVEFPDGTKMEALGNENDEPCHDCRVSPGGRHHPGCDNEKCPKCYGQLIGCGCLDKPEEDEEEDE